ncbi:hypothetical protein [[Eubacterium] cellulosolvens]
MTIKKPEPKPGQKLISCPNCKAEISIEDLGMVMFESCTVFSCPVCSKTIAIQPKGDEFKIEAEAEPKPEDNKKED